MEPGDRFDRTGYEEVANIQTDRGSVMLLHNNSTHYLIAEEEDHDSMVDGNQWVTLIESMLYDKFGSTFATYGMCLIRLTDAAMARNQSLKEDK